MAEQVKEDKRFTTPEGRLINHSFFIRDQFNDQAAPSYKGEMAFEPDDVWPDDKAANFAGSLIDRCYQAAVDEWGEGADLDENLVIPILDGDILAKKREAKGKEGDAYKGKQVIRFNTKFNRHGEDGPGGIDVYDENVDRIEPLKAHDIYRGSFGQVLLTIAPYIGNNNDGTTYHALTFYLSAYQKTGDGDKLMGESNTADKFNKVAGSKPAGDDSAAGTSSGRQRRARGS